MDVDDESCAKAGIRVDATKMTRDDAQDFKAQVQGAWLRRNHEVKGLFSINRMELRDHEHRVSVHAFGDSGREIWSHHAATPRTLADAVYLEMGGTNPPPKE